VVENIDEIPPTTTVDDDDYDNVETQPVEQEIKE